MQKDYSRMKKGLAIPTAVLTLCLALFFMIAWLIYIVNIGSYWTYYERQFVGYNFFSYMGSITLCMAIPVVLFIGRKNVFAGIVAIAFAGYFFLEFIWYIALINRLTSFHVRIAPIYFLNQFLPILFGISVALCCFVKEIREKTFFLPLIFAGLYIVVMIANNARFFTGEAAIRVLLEVPTIILGALAISLPGKSKIPQQQIPAQPIYQQPVYQQPVYQQPVYQQTVYQQPAPGYPQPPVYQQPVYQQPVYQQPVYQQPVYQQPVQQPQPQPVQQPQQEQPQQ